MIDYNRMFMLEFSDYPASFVWDGNTNFVTMTLVGNDATAICLKMSAARLKTLQAEIAAAIADSPPR